MKFDLSTLFPKPRPLTSRLHKTIQIGNEEVVAYENEFMPPDVILFLPTKVIAAFRAGRLDEAVQLIKDNPKQCAIIKL